MAGHVRRFAAPVLLTSVLAWGACAWSMGPQDPFVPPGKEQMSNAQGEGSAPTQSGLTGVRMGRHAGAVIDGEWVRRGRTARGAKLIEIERTRVTLLHPDGHKEVIEMYPPAGAQADASASAPTEAAKP